MTNIGDRGTKEPPTLQDQPPTELWINSPWVWTPALAPRRVWRLRRKGFHSELSPLTTACSTVRDSFLWLGRP